MGRLDCGEGYSIVWLPGLPADHTLRVWLVVGLGVDRIVDALRLLLECTPPLTHSLAAWVLRGVVVCVGLLVPVSSVNRCRSSTPGLSTQ